MIRGIARLQDSELFGALTEEELSKLAPFCSDFVILEDAVVFTEGRAASHLYLVTEGQIALQKAIRVPHARHSRRTTVALCGPRDVVGWSALVEPFKYTLSAMGWESSRLISVDAKLLRRALDVCPEMGYKVMMSLSAVMSRRLRQTTEALISERQVSLCGWRI